MKITLKDIAKDTGLSISTVSRALTNSKKISRQNIKKVFESAHRLNYPFHYGSAPIDLRDSIYIALVTVFHPGEFYASFFNGFAKASQGTNIHLGLFNICEKNDCGYRFIESVKKKHFDAAVLFVPRFTKSNYQELLSRVDDFPMVSAAPLATPVMDTISFDNYSGGHLVAKHFHEKGYRKIGIIQGPSAEVETHLRKNGMVDYCEQNGLEIIWTFKTDYDISSGKRAYQDFKQLKNKPEAIFAGNDALAIGFIHSAAKDGLKAPDDFAISGYDNTPMCEYLNSPLTSVETPFEQLGKSIIELITEQLSQPDKNIRHSGSTKLIPVRLIERNST
jgi:DNA-binding LacI/PurR family transcriptional regulator